MCEISVKMSESSRKLQEEQKCLAALKQWVRAEIKFNGRQDDEFLFMFIRSCEYDIELSKVTYIKYYDCFKKYPQWFTNRDLITDGLYQHFHNNRVSTITNSDDNEKKPTVVFSRISRVDTNQEIDIFFKLTGIYVEFIIRRRGTQFSGFVWVIDCQNVSWKFAFKMMSPTIIRNYLNAFHLSMPIRINAIIVLNAPAMAVTLYNAASAFMNNDLKNKFHITGSDHTELFEIVPAELIPEEYGGKARKFDELADIFLGQLLEFDDYIKTDDYYFECQEVES